MVDKKTKPTKVGTKPTEKTTQKSAQKSSEKSPKTKVEPSTKKIPAASAKSMPKSKKVIDSHILPKAVSVDLSKFKGQLDNNDVDSKLLKGKYTVLYFYPKDLTSGCTTEANDFQNLLKDFGKLDVQVIGVSKDSCASHAKFQEKENLHFSLISDASGAICELFGTWVEKSMYGRKYMGIERSTFVLDAKAQIVAQWRGVKVAGHAALVLQTVKGLLA